MQESRKQLTTKFNVKFENREKNKKDHGCYTNYYATTVGVVKSVFRSLKEGALKGAATVTY